LDHSQQAVASEIALVSRNPFFQTGKQVCALMVANDYDIRGAIDSIATYSLDDVIEFQRRHYRPEYLTAALAGPVSPVMIDRFSSLIDTMPNNSAPSSPSKRFRRTLGDARRLWVQNTRPVNTCSYAF
jgi:predicted Zn-dependent peptidase